MRVNAIVLAGAPNCGRLREVDSAPYEALVTICGRPMVGYVVNALENAQYVDDIVVVGPEGELRGSLGVKIQIAKPKGSIVQNILSGLEFLPEEKPVLLTASDVPMVTGEIVDGFLEACDARSPKADLYYPIVERRFCEEKFPGTKRLYIHTKDGTFTGGNIGVMTPAAIRKSAPTADKLIESRKSPLKMASVLGWGLILKLLFRQVTVADCEMAVSRLFGIHGVAVQIPYSEIGVDVDKPSDLELARKVITSYELEGVSS